MRTAEVRLYDAQTGRLVERMGQEPIADAIATMQWVLNEQAQDTSPEWKPHRVRLIETGSY